MHPHIHTLLVCSMEGQVILRTHPIFVGLAIAKYVWSKYGMFGRNITKDKITYVRLARTKYIHTVYILDFGRELTR